MGTETPLFAPFYTKNASFHQDRLGTNIGKPLKKRVVAFPYGKGRTEARDDKFRLVEAVVQRRGQDAHT